MIKLDKLKTKTSHNQHVAIELIGNPTCQVGSTPLEIDLIRSNRKKSTNRYGIYVPIRSNRLSLATNENAFLVIHFFISQKQTRLDSIRSKTLRR